MSPTTTRPTATLLVIHTFYPDAQADLDRAVADEKAASLAMARAGDDPPRSRASDPSPRQLAEADRDDARARIEAARAIISTGVVKITLQGLARRPYYRLLAEHAPRPDDPLDAQFGYNVDTFGNALIKACTVATTDVHGTPVPNQWDEWADDETGMTPGAWEDVFTKAVQLCGRRTGPDPRLRVS